MILIGGSIPKCELKNLSLEISTNAVLKEIATSAPKLVELTISYIVSGESLTKDYQFNELKSLSIHQLENVVSLELLLEKCPKIEIKIKINMKAAFTANE